MINAFEDGNMHILEEEDEDLRDRHMEFLMMQRGGHNMMFGGREREHMLREMNRMNARGFFREMERERERDRERRMNGRGGRMNRDEDENIINQEIEEVKDENIYFEDLINFPKKIFPKEDEEEMNIPNLYSKNLMAVNNVNKLLEDIFFYCSPPDTLKKLSKNTEEEKTYEFYQELNSKNFIYAQKTRNKILTDLNTKIKSLIKEQKLSNFNDSLSIKMSSLPKGTNEQEKNNQIKNAYSIINKIEEIRMTYKEINDNEILVELKNLKEIIQNNKIEIKALGSLTFNSIENNLCSLLNLIIDEFDKKKDENLLNNFGLIFNEIFDSFKSVKLLFLFIKFLSSHRGVSESVKIDMNKPNQFISEKSLNFEKICNENNLKKKLEFDFKLFLKDEEVSNKNPQDFLNYYTINYEDDLFVFLNPNKFETVDDGNNNIEDEDDKKDDEKDKKEKESSDNSNPGLLYYLKLNLNEGRVTDFGKIKIGNCTIDIIVDLNISIKNEFVYIFTIFKKKENNKKKYILKSQIYNQSTMGKLKEEIIKLEESFIPNKLLNDYKYLYCISSTNDVLTVQKKYKLDNQNYGKFTCKLDEEGKMTEMNNLNSFQMYNSLSINNLFLLENRLENKKYISKFATNGKDEYFLYMKLLSGNNNNNEIKLSFNNNRFVIIKLMRNGLLYNITNKDFNNLIDRGISLLPFSSDYYHNNNMEKNLNEYLLQQFSFFVNIYGNFGLLNNETEKNLIYEPFSYCCNFQDYNLKFLIKKIEEEKNLDTKLYYLIILKQSICSFYNSGIFKEEKIQSLINFFKQYIKNIIKSNLNDKNKDKDKDNMIIKEITNILMYINGSSIIEIDDINDMLKEDKTCISTKTKFLLIELFLEQKNIKKEDIINLYSILINFEKNYLINSFKNTINKEKNDIQIPNYSLFKKIMTKASEYIYTTCIKDKEEFNKLLSLTNTLIDNIKEIFSEYMNVIASNSKISLYDYSFIYNSLNFRIFYFIIQKIISNKNIIKKEIIKNIYDTLLFLDKNNIKDNYYDLFDMNNLIEIKSSSLRNIDVKIPIELHENKNIVIKASLTSNEKISELIQITLTKKNNEKYDVNLDKDQDLIFYNIKRIEIGFLIKNQPITKKDFIINIMPLKDEEKYLLYKKNKDDRIISLIQKSIIYCLLNLLDDIKNDINIYNEDKIIKNHAKIYQNKLLKTISILDDSEGISTSKEKSNSQIVEKTNKVMNDINTKLGYDPSHDSLKLFEKEDDGNDKINEDDSNGKNKKDEIFDDSKFKKLIEYFEEDLVKKNPNKYKIYEKEGINLLILEIFKIAIKYYSHIDKLSKFIKDLNFDEINKNKIEDVLKDNYIFYSLYKESYKIYSLFLIDRNYFDPSNFQEESKKYINDNLTILKLLYDIIVPQKDITPDTLIVDDIINLLKSLKDVEIEEIKNYSKVQTKNCEILLNEFILITNLLNYLNKEENLTFLLNLMNKKIRQKYNKGETYFVYIYGSDYSIMNRLKNQFNDLLRIIYNKKVNKADEYSTITQYCFLESLIWKIKESDFDLLNEIISMFVDLNTINKNQNKDVFGLEYKNIFNIKYFNEETLQNRKIELFESLVSQIINNIKEKIINKKINKDKYTEIIEKLFSFLYKVEPENIYYHDFILFFYKNFINSDTLLKLLSQNQVKKIMDISFNDGDIKGKKIFTKLIMIKLFNQILENINIEEKKFLFDCCKLHDDKIQDDKNPFLYLYEKIFSKLNDNNFDEDKIISKYYTNLLLICLKKLKETENNSDMPKELIKNNFSTLVLLFNNNYLGTCENKFITNPSALSQEFENVCLFNSSDDVEVKGGKIISFLNTQENKSIMHYLADRTKYYFDKNNFEFYTSNKKIFGNDDDNDNNAFAIIDDTLESELFKITSTSTKMINSSEIIYKEDNSLNEPFIKDNSKLIADIIIQEFDKLNEKGVYFALKLISNTMKYLNKEVIMKILNIICKYYSIKKDKEDEYIFISLEYIDDKINKMLSDSYSNNKNLYKEDINNNKSLTCLFNYFIKDRSLGLCLKSSNKIKWYNNILTIPDNNEEKEIFKTKYKLTDLSFYKCHENDMNQEIKKDSILFTKIIEDENDINNLKAIIADKSVKIIITKEFHVEQSIIDNFITENSIPIYIITNNVYDKFINFFIEGKGGNIIDIKTNTSSMENSSSIVDIYLFGFKQRDTDSQQPKEDIKINNSTILKDSDSQIISEDIDIQFERSANNFSNNNEMERKKKYKLVDDIEDIFCLTNVKIIKRLLYDIICSDMVKIEEIIDVLKQMGNKTDNDDKDKYIRNFVYILEVLSMEYYFNIRHNLSNCELKHKLKNYFRKISNEWIKVYFKEYTDKIINKSDNDQERSEDEDNYNYYNRRKKKQNDCLSLFGLDKYISQEILFNNFNSFDDIIYDKLLFILRESVNSNNEKSFVNKYFDIVKRIIEKIISKKSSRYHNYSDDEDEDDKNNSNDGDNNNNKPITLKTEDFVEMFVFKVLSIIYDYLINNYEKIQDFNFINEDLNAVMVKLMEEYIDINEYFNGRQNKKISKKDTLLIQISFKYLDFCLLLFFKQNSKLFEYWFKSRNKLFLFYCNYKFLSTEKYYNKNDYKQLFSLIAHISDSIKCFHNDNGISNNSYKNIIEMKFNDYKKYTADVNGEDFITSFSVENLDKEKENEVKYSYNKLAIFCLDKSNKEEKEKYILQDIIDINELKRKKISYKLKLEKEIYLLPLNNIPTHLYAFGYNYSHSLGINGALSKICDTPTKCSGLQKYSWNFSYGQNYCLSLNEEDNKIYASGCGKGAGLDSKFAKEFTDKIRINDKLFEKDKIVDFATGNCKTSMLLTQSGEVYAIGANEENFLKIHISEKNRIKTPLKMNIIDNLKIKVVSMSISHKNCYLIDNKGELYGIGDNSRSQILDDPDTEVECWEKIALPEGCQRFLQCANGERYLICLVEDDKGNGKIYARGINSHNECGIKSTEDHYISNLTPCDETYNLNFKSIYTRNSRSAAITVSGELFVWGKKCYVVDRNNKSNSYYDDGKDDCIKCPTIMRYDSNLKNVIIDEVAISSTHILAIGRSLENGNYVRKLLSCGNNRKGALGVKINSFEDTDNTDKLSEVKIINENDENSRLIPIKLSIGDNRSFVLCLDENQLIHEIKTEKSAYQNFAIKINHFFEENLIEKLHKFYESKYLDKFVNLFRSLTHQCYSGFVESLDKMKMEQNIKTAYIYYAEFLNYLERNNQMHDLFMIFGNKKNNNEMNQDENESIYNYLKTRIMLIEDNIMKYCSINMRSKCKQFLQKIIVNNISYLPDKVRENKFNELLSELPRQNGELKSIKVDRFKAKAFYDKYNESNKKISDFELDETIFGQVFHAMEDVDSKEYFIGNNCRLFIVILQGEHASDSGGPYHEVISNICDELQSDYLDLFIKNPNNINKNLLNDKYILNPNSNRKIHNKAYEFLGKLMASSISTGEALDLNLHPCIWKSLLGHEINFYDYESIDYDFYSLINNLESLHKEEDFEQFDLNFVIHNSNGTEVELKSNGSSIKLNSSNLKEYLELAKDKRVNEFKNQIEFLKKGFYSAISYDYLQVLNWRQLEEMVCGKNKFDIQDFKKHTKYEGYTENDTTIKWFWEWFEETDENDRFKYLKFVSGRSRLPKSELGFRYKHVISKSVCDKENSYPKSTTCFFKLNLPHYDSKEKLVEKMKYSILNCIEIDTDQ